MNSMNRVRRIINQKYEKGLIDGSLGNYAPGLIFGDFRNGYDKGYQQGKRVKMAVKRLTDFKTK